MEIEKNDVNLSELFRWNKKVSILGPNGEELGYIIYMRLVGDADLNRARVFGLRSSAILRKELKTPGTDKYEAYISQIKDQEKDVLIKAIILFEIPTLSEESRREVDIKFPMEPSSDAPLEEHENYQKEVDEFPKKFADASEKILRKKIKQEEKRLEPMDEAALKQEYINSFIGVICQEEMSKKFSDMCIYLGTYKDKKFKRKVFESFDEFDNAAPELKEQLRRAYSELELRMPELKKSQRATQSQQPGALLKDNG
jgi:hypothetical protein